MSNKEKEEKEIHIVIPDIDFEDIDSIVNKGMKSKISFIRYLKNCFRELGFKNIFHDKTELVIIFLIGIILLLAPMFKLKNLDIEELYQFVFIGSPIIYLGVVVFSFYNSKEKGAFDIEMTCKYNLYQLASIRMFIFSLINILINTFSIVIIWSVVRQIDVIRVVIISITGLLLFSTIFLYSLLKLKWNISKYFIITSWIVVNLFLDISNNKAYEDFLIKVPLYIHLIITSICIVLYIKNLNKLINYRRKRGEI